MRIAVLALQGDFAEHEAVFHRLNVPTCQLRQKSDLELDFDDWGMRISAGGQRQSIMWKDVKSAVKQYNMIFIRSDAKHGYMLNKKMLGNQKEEFWKFLQSKVSHN